MIVIYNRDMLLYRMTLEYFAYICSDVSLACALTDNRTDQENADLFFDKAKEFNCYRRAALYAFAVLMDEMKRENSKKGN